MKKIIIFFLVLFTYTNAWSQTAASYYVSSVELANTTLTDENWFYSIEDFMAGMNEIARIFNTGVITYRVDRLNSLEEQLLQRAHSALSNETIRRGETWQVMLDYTLMANAPRGTRAYSFIFHRESNGELYYLVFRRDK